MRKDVLHTKILSGQSLASNFTSPVTPVDQMDNISYQINIATTNSTGSFFIDASDDYQYSGTAVINPGSWVQLTLSGTPFAGAANDNIIVSLNQVPFKAVRLRYTSTIAGTGTCDVYVGNKQIGG